MTAEDPGIVFSVKELIGRLDGKLDAIVNMLANKADRADVAQLGDRVGRVENTVAEMHQREVEREAARLAKRKADEEARHEASVTESNHREKHRFTLSAFIATLSAFAGIAAVVVMIIALQHH